MHTRSISEPSRWKLIAIQPAKAWVVYALAGLMFVVLIVMAFGYYDLLSRTRALCEPLRAGQAQTKDAKTDVGRSFARTFGDSADKLGCDQ